MKNYTLNNGSIIKAEDTKSFVEQLNTLSWFNHKPTIEEYMKTTSVHTAMQTGHNVRIDSTETFVEDLISAGLIKVDN